MHIEPLIKINLCRVCMADVRMPCSLLWQRCEKRAHSAGGAEPSSQGLQYSAGALTLLLPQPQPTFVWSLSPWRLRFSPSRLPLACHVLCPGGHLPWAVATSSPLSPPAGKWWGTEPMCTHLCSLTSPFGLLEELAVSTEPVSQTLGNMAQLILCPPYLCCPVVMVQHHCWDAALAPLCLARTPAH